jgi:hypothetical protein
MFDRRMFSLEDTVPVSRRSVGRMLAAATLFALPKAVRASCAAPPESGRWRNLDPKGEPAYIDVKMAECGDQVLNGHQTRTSYSLRCWVRLSNGRFHGRPTVKAAYRSWKGREWLVGKVYTGGYQDHVWVLATDRGVQPHLHVLIRHESLDSKPSAQSEHWFRRVPK